MLANRWYPDASVVLGAGMPHYILAQPRNHLGLRCSSQRAMPNHRSRLEALTRKGSVLTMRPRTADPTATQAFEAYGHADDGEPPLGGQKRSAIKRLYPLHSRRWRKR